GGAPSEPAASAAADTAATPAAARSPHLASLLAAMDRSADPCQDFYRYACGGWLDATERPADQARWTRSFSTIREENREVVRTLIERAAANPSQGPDHARIGNLYGACMDEPAIEKAGLAPLAPYRARIAEVDDAASLLRVAGELQRHGASPLLGLGVLPDFKRPDVNIAFFVQGGLGMPERDYYVSEDPKKRELLAAYRRHVATMLGFLGHDAETAAARAGAVVDFETALAEASRPAAEMRVVERLYHKIDLAGLQELTPKLPWDAFLAGIGHPGVREINVATPEFFEGLEELVLATPPETLRAYLEWHLMDAAAELLPADVVAADFAFYGRKLQGQQEIEPRWKRCVDLTQQALGEAVGKLYVEERFAGDSKEIALEMIRDIEAAFETSLPALSWMDETTRERAVEKAQAIGNKIGYPDRWEDYSAMKTTPGDFFGNAVAAAHWGFDDQLRKVGQPVDETEWGMTPQTVNASYNPLLNHISFPAGILQPPFFHRELPAAMNYGAIGVVMGHELTHGFDDMGRKFDPQGQMREWWEPAVAGRFEERAQCVRDQYSAYEVEPGVHVQGALTAGENIADIGGVKQAYAAFKSWQERHDAKGRQAIAELTDDQLFFVAFAQVWCTEASPEYQRMQVTTDPHSPARFRVIGPLASTPAFAEAFACEPGTPMAPVERCEVW
ncbi:MAG TPA: M13 family metallopeptidase, partial [Thermoanaerobaculia bacterium]|nr:M13 family metallopeptidase [Thermoanaerobaculia bacterium]